MVPEANAPAPPARRHRQTKDYLTATPNPSWVDQMITRQQPAWSRATENALFRATAAGEVPERTWRRFILEFW
jgi:hypothetical protein